MLKLEQHEINTANSFLKSLGANIKDIEFIHKNNTYYNTKTKEELKDLLSYILLKYPLISDIHISKRSNGIDIRSRMAGNLQNLNATCLPDNNYATIEIDGITFLNSYFNRHIKNILNTQHDQEDFIDDISIPLCGSYRLRSSTRGEDACIRLLKVNNLINNPTMKSNVLYLQEKPYYIIDILKLDGSVDHNVIKLTDNIKEMLELYKKNIDKVFNHLTSLTENIYLSTASDFKLKLEQKKDSEIKATILKNYNFSTIEKNIVLDYLINNYKVFYNPVFSYFIEDCIGLEKDSIIGEFKSPEALLDYLTAIKMLKI